MKKETPLLELQDLTVEFRISRKSRVHAVSGVNFKVYRGETVGLVGESGCGKTSVARAIMQLPPPASGHVFFQGEDLTSMPSKALKRLRPKFQMILQDSISSLNPRRKVGRSIAIPLKVASNNNNSGIEQRQAVKEMMARVGLDPETYDFLPHQFSGGECQRIQIARALIAKPLLLICDEPVSSLDVSVQAQILNLLEALRERLHLTMLFISHDLAVIKNISDRVVVMYLGKICEIGPSEELYARPRHPYTEALLNALPDPGKSPLEVDQLGGDIPSPTDPPQGCRFHSRCPKSYRPCTRIDPPLKEIGPDHFVACHLVIE